MKGLSSKVGGLGGWGEEVNAASLDVRVLCRGTCPKASVLYKEVEVLASLETILECESLKFLSFTKRWRTRW